MWAVHWKMAAILWNNKGRLPRHPKSEADWKIGWGLESRWALISELVLCWTHSSSLQSRSFFLTAPQKSCWNPLRHCLDPSELLAEEERRLMLTAESSSYPSMKKILVWTKTEVFHGLSISINFWTFPGHKIHPPEDEWCCSLSREEKNHSRCKSFS